MKDGRIAVKNNKKLTIELNKDDLKAQFKFFSACTLDPDYLGENDSGWKITGKVTSDYYEWVNHFEAVHSEYGFVTGDFEEKIFATSKETYDHFIKYHAPRVWDYGDI
jgi:hypothetical protein